MVERNPETFGKLLCCGKSCFLCDENEFYCYCKKEDWSKPGTGFQPFPTQNLDWGPVVPTPHEIGLPNLGHTCFINATLQVLFNLPDFVKDLQTAADDRRKTTCLPRSLDFFLQIAEARSQGLSGLVDNRVNGFDRNVGKLHFSYRQGIQQDAFLFLNRFLEELKNGLPVKANPIESHFEFEFAGKLTCLKCGMKGELVSRKCSIWLPYLHGETNVIDCIKVACDERIHRVRCGGYPCKNDAASGSFKFRTLPKKLILCVKRFAEDTGKVLLGGKVIAPKEIDLSPFVEAPNRSRGSTKFSLVAQIIHFGDSLNGGRYENRILCEDQVWRVYRDEHFEISDCYFISDTAYIDFYVLNDV